jgi:hypothetical protein
MHAAAIHLCIALERECVIDIAFQTNDWWWINGMVYCILKKNDLISPFKSEKMAKDVAFQLLNQFYSNWHIKDVSSWL